jgi:predicted enzyme related to lactoylglutathione lyase
MAKTGKILWQDLTVKDAAAIKDFYCEVVGWTASAVAVGDHEDYNIHDQDGNVIAGICHNKGALSNFPAQWLNYVIVENVAASTEKCKALGGKVIVEPSTMGGANFVVIEDPAGAVIALMEDQP